MSMCKCVVTLPASSCKIAIMATKCEECVSCFRNTKYSCITCHMPVYNLCSFAEVDEENRSLRNAQVTVVLARTMKMYLIRKRKKMLKVQGLFVFVCIV